MKFVDCFRLSDTGDLMFLDFQNASSQLEKVSSVKTSMGGHMCADLYYVPTDAPQTLKKKDQVDHYAIEKIRDPHLKLFPGYYSVFVLAEDRYIYTDNSFVSDTIDDGEDSEVLSLSTFVGPNTKTSNEGNGLLAKYLIEEKYKVHTITSGSDLSVILIQHSNSKYEKEFKKKLLNQTLRSTPSDITIISNNVDLF